ncbi:MULTISPECIES: hypothetical protein [unclassified Corynebacterium]|uniref:hypothetical protein n=1 Tax=unclassified Corynebacterium TaxID=2624378 RepID=UPI00143A8DF6|nr:MULTISPECIES: hypothetical protein [unclassified Corynebacterium]MDU4705036.1 hypothetical protein [Corynebacterium sp.]
MAYVLSQPHATPEERALAIRVCTEILRDPAVTSRDLAKIIYKEIAPYLADTQEEN